MIFRILIVFLILFQVDSFGQSDSVWNAMILKKGNQPKIKDNMAEFSETGFYLYRNCFYDLKFRDKTKKTLRLIDIKLDTLTFIGISEKRDSNLAQAAKDTFLIDYKSIDKLLLIKDWGAENSKKINCDDYYFIFHKSIIDNRYESKYAYVFPSGDSKDELVPRLSSDGITYHYEYGGKLYYYSGFTVQTTKYSDEQKTKALNGVLTVLNLIVNKRLDVTIQKPKQKKDE
jgi:hypothetical protein